MEKGRLYSVAIFLLVLLNCILAFDAFSGNSKNSKLVGDSNADTTKTRVQIDILNGCGVNGVGSFLTDYCRQIGYDVVEMGNYKRFNVSQTLVIDRSGKPGQSEILAHKLGISPDCVIQQFSDDHLVTASIVIGKDYASLPPWKK